MSTNAYFNNFLTETNNAKDNHYGEWLRRELIKSTKQKVVAVPLTVKNVDDFLKWLNKEV